MRPFLRSDGGALFEPLHTAREPNPPSLSTTSAGSSADSQIELPDGVQPSSLTASTTAAVPRQRALSATSVAWCCDRVAATVTGLIRLEMIECLRTTSG
jgi:hypothetical protein